MLQWCQCCPGRG